MKGKQTHRHPSQVSETRSPPHEHRPVRGDPGPGPPIGVAELLIRGDFAADDADAGDVAYLPIGYCAGLTTVQAGCFLEAGRALRTDAAGLEGVELGLTLVATPEGADGRRGPAAGTGEPLAAGNLFKLAQGACGLEAVPAIEACVGGDEAGPNGLFKECEHDEPGDSEEAQKRSDQQAARAAERKPEQGAKNLAAVEGVDGENVENQQNDVCEEDRKNQLVSIWIRFPPIERIDGFPCDGQGNSQRNVHKRSCGDAPQGCAGALRGIDIGDAAERPEHDFIRGSTDGAAGKSMTKLVQQDDHEERQVFEGIPDDGAVLALPCLDFIQGD